MQSSSHWKHVATIRLTNNFSGNLTMTDAISLGNLFSFVVPVLSSLVLVIVFNSLSLYHYEFSFSMLMLATTAWFKVVIKLNQFDH